jgi:HK97 family phage portal protein
MIVRTYNGNRSVGRMFEGVDRIPSPSQGGSGWSFAGRRVSWPDAAALPAVLCAIRLLSETTGSMPMIVYSGVGDDRMRDTGAPQSEILHSKPNAKHSPFGFYSYVVASMNGAGGALILKTKSRRQVEELWPLSPSTWYPKREAGELVFKYREQGQAGEKTLTTDDVIYVPAILAADPLIGISPIEAHRNSLGTALAIEEFGGRFFANDASPGGIIKHPQFLQKEKRDEIREGWESRHRGGGASHRVGILVGGAEFQQIGVNLADAQFIEAQRYSVEEIARIFRVPSEAIGGYSETKPSTRATPEQRNLDLLTFSLMPWLIRIEQALHADDDLFPDKGLYPEFLTDGILRADTISRYGAYLPARQAGWLTANEVRRMENLPPVEGGDQLQTTPVGGAPNATPAGQPQPNDVAPLEPSLEGD